MRLKHRPDSGSARLPRLVYEQWPPRGNVAPQLRYDPCSLEGDPPAHLRAAVLAVVPRAPDLSAPEAGAQGAVGQVDLERVARAANALEVDRLEHFGGEALE